MAKGGYIIEITEGADTGYFGTVTYTDQVESFVQIKKVFARLYMDSACTEPLMNDGKKVYTLIHLSKIKRIGFFD